MPRRHCGNSDAARASGCRRALRRSRGGPRSTTCSLNDISCTNSAIANGHVRDAVLEVGDIRGVYVLPPTPCLPDAGGWDATDSVDLDETARMTEFLISPGVTGLGLFGTTGEGHSLLWEEKLTCASAVVEAARGRVQIFAGATALGTREVIRQMRGLRDAGVDGALVGLPLWQTPTVENAVQFYADLSAAVPDLPVMVYSNSWFFKF